MMIKLIFLGLIPVLMLIVSNVSATGIRGDSDEDATDEEHNCWVNGYDSGFAGKYDSDRARECIEHDDSYNRTWTIGCEDSFRTEEECGELINNPVEIEDFEALYNENRVTCRSYGYEDGKANKAYDKERASGCGEFGGNLGGYKDGYQSGCETHTTESSCELIYEDKQFYCRDNPDVGGCTEFLHNATNKIPGEASALTGCIPVNVTCSHESNPERYCLNYNDTEFCKTIGDICDPDGFVRPEYPYCKGD
ncbi:MAG: hypothetical protein ACRD8W_24880 [Nitrososphaeraceae archaeon]